MENEGKFIYCKHFSSKGLAGVLLYDVDNARLGIYINGILDATFSSPATPFGIEGLPYNLPMNL